MNDHSKTFTARKDPVEKLLSNYYQEKVCEDPDFLKMAEQAMTEGNLDPAYTNADRGSRTKSWYPIYKRAFIAAVTIFILIGLLKLSFFAAPRWEQFAYAAIQSAPFSEYLIYEKDIGLLREVEKGNIQVHQLTDTVNGFRIDIVGSYADSNRTIIFFQVVPPAGQQEQKAAGWMPVNIKLVDQFGISRTKSYSVIMNSDNNKGMMEFPGIPDWLSKLGVRFHLEIGTLDWTNADHTTRLAGPWVMNWVQESHDAKQTIYPGTSATISGTVVKLKKVTLATSSTKLNFTAEVKESIDFGRGSSVLQGDDVQNGKGTGPEIKPPGDEKYIEKVSDGTRFDTLSSEFSTGGLDKVGKGELLFPPLEEPGEYHLIIKRLNGIDGEWILPFTIGKR